MQMNKIIGHKYIFNYLKNLFEMNILPNKILLSGKKGIGKSLLVNQLLNYIYLKDCKSNMELLINNKTHPNIFRISKNEDKKNIEIFQIREMIKFQNH